MCQQKATNKTSAEDNSVPMVNGDMWTLTIIIRSSHHQQYVQMFTLPLAEAIETGLATGACSDRLVAPII